MLWHVLVFAFLMVILSTALMTPILLFLFDLRSSGWKWQHAALFAAIIAPTDAVSVSSILKKGRQLSTSQRCKFWCPALLWLCLLTYHWQGVGGRRDISQMRVPACSHVCSHHGLKSIRSQEVQRLWPKGRRRRTVDLSSTSWLLLLRAV